MHRMAPWQRKLGASLLEYRRERNLTQREAARLCKLTEIRFSRIERGIAVVNPAELDNLAALELDWPSILPNLAERICSGGGDGQQ